MTPDQAADLAEDAAQTAAQKANIADGYAVDSSLPVTADMLALLEKETGRTPFWWGRYLGAVDAKGTPIVVKRNGVAEFNPTLNAPKEAPILEASGVRLVSIARRSSQVCLGSDAGEKCGREDAELLNAVLTRFPSTSKRLFLDVEMTPTLTSFFYKAWSTEVQRAGFEPAVYMPNSQNWRAQWEALQTAILRGAPCFGTWVAGYFGQSAKDCDEGTNTFSRETWQPHKAEGPANAPALAWQYLGNAYGKKFDFSILNPAVDPWW